MLAFHLGLEDRIRSGACRLRTRYTSRVELLNFLLIFACGYLLLRHPERERLAFGLAITSALLMTFLFLVGTRTSLLPGLNY